MLCQFLIFITRCRLRPVSGYCFIFTFIRHFSGSKIKRKQRQKHVVLRRDRCVSVCLWVGRRSVCQNGRTYFKLDISYLVRKWWTAASTCQWKINWPLRGERGQSCYSLKGQRSRTRTCGNPISAVTPPHVVRFTLSTPKLLFCKVRVTDVVRRPCSDTL